MGLIKWLGDEIKDSFRDFAINIVTSIDYFHFGYIKGDDHSKAEFKFHMLRAYHSIGAPYRQIKYGITNLRKWFMIIWKDRDFDNGFTLELLNHKLRLMETFFRSSNTCSMDAYKVADEIKEAREILASLIDETYEDEIYEEYYKKYPHKEFKFRPCDSEKERIDKGLPARMYVMDNGSTEDSTKMFRECMEKAETKRIELKKRLYEILCEKSDGWWD